MSGGAIGGVRDALFGNPDDAYNGVEQAPDPTKQGYTPGTDTASTYSAQQVGPNALAGANGSSVGQSAQQQALARLQQQAKGGLTDSDKASLYQTLGQQAEQNRGAQGAILQGAAARGGTNAGSTLGAQLAAQQANQEGNASAAVDAAGQASQRAQQANTQAGELGGNIDQAAFGKQAAIGAAQNSLNAFNADAGNKASQFNAGAQNAASQFNIGNDIQSKQFMAALLQQKYRNQLDEAGARAGLSVNEAGQSIDLLKSGAGAVGAALGAAHGGKIPGKPVVPGDSAKNDTVHAMLSPGEIVIPRSAVGSPEKMLAFLERETGLQFDSAMKARSAPAKLKA